jgi:SAM-dependent methyltransferase
MVAVQAPVAEPLPKDSGTWKDYKGTSFPIRNGVIRIVPGEDYTDNFGFQWNKFEKVQIDRFNRHLSASKLRFFSETGWDKEDLAGKDVLEVGCGAGRFSQVVMEHTHANLFSVDLSDAVEANYRNNWQYGKRLKIFQASIYELPFADKSFDRIFCFGVLQHTPDFKKSIFSLASKLKPGGEMVVDFYPVTGWWTKIHAKYLFRPFTKRMKHEKLLHLVEKNVDWLMKLYYFFDKIKLGKLLNRFLPIPDIKHTIPDGLNKKELREWVILDTFDMFSPKYDRPQKISTVKKWAEEAGLKVSFFGFVRFGNSKAAVVRATRQTE